MYPSTMQAEPRRGKGRRYALIAVIVVALILFSYLVWLVAYIQTHQPHGV